MLDQDEVRDLFMQGYHCSQVVFMECADELGIDRDEAARIASSLGGGMFRGDTCGAVGGAMLAIGARYGACEPNDEESDRRMRAKVKEFQDQFTERFGTTFCRELLGYDFSKPEEIMKASQAGVMMAQCPDYVSGALEILEDIL